MLENMHINMLNDNILVTELTDDIFINGVTTIYDSDSPYMFCKPIMVAEEAMYDLMESNTHSKIYDEWKDANDEEELIITKKYLSNIVLVIKRYAKEEFLPGYYFISSKDVRCVLDVDDYNTLKV